MTSILHIHKFDNAIVSMYWTFSIRKIIYECECGKRKAIKVYRDYYEGVDFPIPTTNFITNKEFDNLLNETK